MREIKVTKENHAEYVAIEYNEYGFQGAVDAMSDLNDALCEELGNSEDWGGRYATWLGKLGIKHETENGWWSLAAIDPDNLEAFVEAMQDETEDGWFDQCQQAKAVILKIEKAGRFVAKSKKVREVVEALNEQV